MVQGKTVVALAALSFVQVQGVTLDTSSSDSIKSAASTIANGMVSYYNGTQPGHAIGVLDAPYYWWEGGAMIDTLIQYWHLTGDTQYNNIVSQALVAQQGPNSDFMPPNQTKTEGNDDQATWALAAMSAAELSFPAPANTIWVTLAEAVFNEQVARWDTSTCNGGLRWQIFTFNTGYSYKNSVSNGFLFQLSSRLARYTSNTTYLDWANKIYDWSTGVGFIDENSNIYDGASVSANCTDIDKVQFSYVAGTYISGAAYLYNTTSYTTSSTENGYQKWHARLSNLLNTTLPFFFPNSIATEIACESHQSCNVDMYAFKGILAQQLVNTIQMAPYTREVIMPYLTASAQAAAKACVGGKAGNECGYAWAKGGNSSTGLGQQLSALSYMQGLLVGQAATGEAGAGGGNGSVSGSGINATMTTGGTSATTTGAPTRSVSKSTGVTLGGERISMAVMGVMGGMLGMVAWLVM